MNGAMSSSPALIDYYRRRADEYERIYQKPERQEDLARMKKHLRWELGGRHILELACGTGYWTAAIAEVVSSLHGIDANTEVLKIARSKQLDPARIVFTKGDAFSPPHDLGKFTAGFAAHWWSHVPLARLPAFLEKFHAALQPGARVVFMDNRYVPGSSTPICRADAAGNTYQQRQLDDGTSHEVLKNFPTANQLREILQCYSDSVRIVEFTYFWCATYDLVSE